MVMKRALWDCNAKKVLHAAWVRTARKRSCGHRNWNYTGSCRTSLNGSLPPGSSTWENRNNTTYWDIYTLHQSITSRNSLNLRWCDMERLETYNIPYKIFFIYENQKFYSSKFYIRMTFLVIFNKALALKNNLVLSFQVKRFLYIKFKIYTKW